MNNVSNTRTLDNKLRVSVLLIYFRQSARDNNIVGAGYVGGELSGSVTGASQMLAATQENQNQYNAANAHSMAEAA
jgi:hypothetical protein